MHALLKTLRLNPISQVLDEQEMEEFARLACPRSYRKGEFLCLQQEAWPYLFILAEGLVKAKKESGDGRNLLVANFYVGEIFWGLTFFDECAHTPVLLEACEPSRVYLWERSRTAPFIEEHGRFAWELCRLLATRMRLASDMLEGLAFQPVASRLARLLLEQYPAGLTAGDRRLTLDEMAARIGSTREMVCRVLYRFAAQGAIEINRTEFIFKDRSLLEKRAYE